MIIGEYLRNVRVVDMQGCYSDNKGWRYLLAEIEFADDRMKTVPNGSPWSAEHVLECASTTESIVQALRKLADDIESGEKVIAAKGTILEDELA